MGAAAMAENDQNDDLDDISEEDAERLLADAVKDDPKDDDPEGAEHLSDPGKRALDRIREDRRQAREERDAARRELDEMRKKLKGHEDAGKTELQRLQEALKAAEADRDKATSTVKRREIAEDRAPDHATAAQIRAVAKRLSGATDEELAADADELFALISPAPAKPTPGKPKERLRSGGGSDDPDDLPDDPRKLAALIPRAR